MASSGDADIAYHDDIADKMSCLEGRFRSPADFTAQHREYSSETDKDQLGGDVESRVEELRFKSTKQVDTNKKTLNALVERIRKASIPEELARKSLAAFGSFAALRLIRILKDGYDIKEGKKEFWFRYWIFNQENSPCVFALAPNVSRSGFVAFGHSYFVLARVGANGCSMPEQFRITMPFVVGEKLLLSRSEGDQEAYFVWVLPQVLLGELGDAALNNFSVNTWVIDRLTGSFGEEWFGGIQKCPWEIYRGLRPGYIPAS